MSTIDIIGSIGVIFMLIAFFLNIFDKLHNDHPFYIVCNLIGSSMACYASLRIEYYPFVVLEGTWALVSLWALIIYFIRDFPKKKTSSRR